MKRKQTLSTLLLERIYKWDEQALAEVYDTYQPAIYRYIYRQLGQADIAEELAAETFLRFLKAIKKRKGPRDNISAWLYRVAHNLVVDFYRRQTAHNEQAFHEGLDIGIVDGTDERLDRAIQMRKARLALRQLTPLQQQIIALRFLEEMTYEQTAQVVNRSVNAVKALQHRAMNRMHRFLEATHEQE